ncbi:MAG: LacI family transcriptional regulator [Treponema sp.]|nr:LacI family transcriptional regulator [Treponema sp.]
MITLKDIAKECGVSFSTVSKALKGSPEIGAETIKIVQQKAQEMSYHPNLAARTLRTNRTYDIGVIFEDQTGSGLQHQYFATIFSSLQMTAMSQGFDVTFMGSPNTAGFDYFAHCKYRNFDGVAILATKFDRPDIQQLIKSDIPTVTLDYISDRDHSAVMNDNNAGMNALLEYIFLKRHTRIAVIHGEATHVTEERIASFQKFTRIRGIKIPESYILQGIYHDPVTSGEATEILLGLPLPPTCIMYPDDFAALGGIRVLNKHKLIIGKDISITGYDGIMLTSMLTPPLTTYMQNGSLIGKLIAEHLIDEIEKTDSCLPSHSIVSGKLIRGASVSTLSQ